MKVGILKDIKVGENRVIATPVEIASLKADGHEVYVQKGAGQKAGFPDEKYAAAGAVMVDTAEEIYRTCDFVAKVKEFEPSEYNLLREGQIVFTCIHPAAHPEEVQALPDKKVIAFTAEDSHRYGSPNCEAAGKQAALSVLHALGAWVTVADINIGLLRTLQSQYNQSINTMISSRENIAAILPETDMILNCVKWPKGNTEYLVTREMVRSMEPGSVLVDISNDEQGAIANSTSVAYAASVLPHFRSILNNGVAQACAKDGFLRRSLTTYKGYLTHEETSALQNRPWIRPEDILGIADQKLDPAPPATVTRSDNFISL